MISTDWQLALRAYDAVIQNGAVIHYGNPQSEITSVSQNNTLCDLTHIGLLEVTGSDAVSFLQGQVTNDVQQLISNQSAHFTGYCTPKGRLLALFLAFAHHDHVHLQFNRALLEPIMKRLKMYVMRSKVEIKDVSESVIRFGLNGPDAEKLLSSLFSQLPSQDYGLLTLENATVIKLPTIAGHTRFQILTNSSQAPAIFDALHAQCKLVGKPCWDWLDIQSGIPDVLPKTQEQFVPQMLNLDVLNGINFKKGCYTGQEIVARTHYLGKVKRRTYMANIAANIAPSEGDKIVDSSNNDAGQIVRVAPNQHGTFDALLELRIEAKQAGHLTWNNAAVQIQPLPYALNDD